MGGLGASMFLSYRSAPLRPPTKVVTTAARVCALVDRPSARVMGMVPIVIASGDTFRVSGVAARPAPVLDAAELHALLQEGHAVAVDAPLPAHVGPLAAIWVGSAWLRSAYEVDAPIVPFELTHAAGDEGEFALVSPEAIYAGLDAWVRTALVRALERRSVGLARLMAAALPDRDETRAALWLTQAGPAAARELSWWARLSRDAGRPDDAEALRQRVAIACHETFADRPSAPDWTGALKALPGPWSRLAAAVRCCERLRPLLVTDERGRSAVDGFLQLARQSVRQRAPLYDAAASEHTRIALLEAARSGEGLAYAPDRLHRIHAPTFDAVEHTRQALDEIISAGPDNLDAYHDERATNRCANVLHAATTAFVDTAYPDRAHELPQAFVAHAESLVIPSIQADIDVLGVLGATGPGHVFEFALWSEGEPPSWAEHIARYRERLGVAELR